MSSESRPPANMYLVFENAFSRTDKTVEFDPKWEWPKNRYKNAVSGPRAPKLEIGRTCSAVDSQGLKYIFIGTRFGNVLVYEPFNGNETDPIYRIYLPPEVELMQLFHGYQLNEHTLSFALGGNKMPNIGERIEGMLPPLEDASQRW